MLSLLLFDIVFAAVIHAVLVRFSEDLKIAPDLAYVGEGLRRMSWG